jgi:hypothetical protein
VGYDELRSTTKVQDRSFVVAGSEHTRAHEVGLAGRELYGGVGLAGRELYGGRGDDRGERGDGVEG